MKKLLITSAMALMLLAGCRDSDENQQDGVEHDFDDMTEEVGPEEESNNNEMNDTDTDEDN